MSIGAQGPDSAPQKTDPPKRRKRRLGTVAPLLAIAAAIAVATILIATHHNSQALPGNVHSETRSDFAGQSLRPRKPAPSFGGLRNYLGEKVDSAAYRGKALLVTFLYTRCPDVCPLITAELHNTLEMLGPARAKQVQIVAISVDPRHDNRQSVTQFLKAHEMTGRMKYLIGNADELGPVWEAWNVGSQRDSVNPEFVAHSALVYGISASGKLTTIYPANFKPSQIVHDVPGLLGT